MKTSYKRPRCPNHGEPLDDIGTPPPNKGSGICPVSGYKFDFEAEWDRAVNIQDKDGNISKQVSFTVSGDKDN